MAHTFQLTSPDFADGEIMPERFTCVGPNVSPALAIHNAPKGAESLALILHDPDAPRGDYIHWTIWNINPGTRDLPEDTVPDAAVQGMNDFGHSRYDGPCPPSGTHRYMFDLYALDASLTLAEGAPEEDLRQAITDYAIAKTSLVGRFGSRALAQ